MTQSLSAAEALLRAAGRRTEADIDLADAALALALFERPDTDLKPYRAHLATLAKDVAEATGPRPVAFNERILALAEVLVHRHGYDGDRETYDDLQNANLIRVIDRRRGLPVALAILWLHAARAQGWPAEGIDFPAHFLIRVGEGSSESILDPFNGGGRLERSGLDALLRRIAGPGAELDSEHCQPVGNRAILLRLQNNAKLRLVKAGRHADAANVVERMLWLAPGEPALWWELGLLQGESGSLRAGLASLDQAARLADDDDARHRIAETIGALRARLN
jgi:regulator of sirC expression with transglutaminase-like and TPR domain